MAKQNKMNKTFLICIASAILGSVFTIFTVGNLPSGLVAQPVGAAEFGAVARVQATMLVMPMGGTSTETDVADPEVILGGTGCGTCPRDTCAARR